jgi:hypothetical protein
VPPIVAAEALMLTTNARLPLPIAMVPVQVPMKALNDIVGCKGLKISMPVAPLPEMTPRAPASVPPTRCWAFASNTPKPGEASEFVPVVSRPTKQP